MVYVTPTVAVNVRVEYPEATVFPLAVTVSHMPVNWTPVTLLVLMVMETVLGGAIVGAVDLKFAVMVPAPWTVVVVEADVLEANVKVPVDDVHEVKAYPDAGDAARGRLAPALTQLLEPAEGEVVPAAVGLAARVTWNCFV
jgi:hypothetical protein